MRSIIQFCLFVVLACNKPGQSFSMASTKNGNEKYTPILTKKSTALDVLKELNKAGRLASYIDLSSNENHSVAVVTGGSSGIGIPTIEALTLANMKVVLCARNIEAANETVLSLPLNLRRQIRIQKLDLSDMVSIQAAAKEIMKSEKKIDVLLNNAGVMAPAKRESTAQNLELQFGTNHVGHHMFTRLLLPAINSNGRVVTVASTAHSFGRLDFSNLNYEDEKERRDYSAWGAYGQSKLANILFAKGLSDKLSEKGSGIKAVSLHPGVISTNLWRYMPRWSQPLVDAIIADKNLEQGAATNVYCCLVTGEEFDGGEYLSDCRVLDPSNQYGKDETGTLRDKLWKATENIIKEKGFYLPDSIL